MQKKSKAFQVKAIVRLQIKGGAANPSPPVGPALGQHGANIMEFCKAFNAMTQTPDQQGKPLTVVITIYEDKKFVFDIKTPITSYLIKMAAGVEKGSRTPNKLNKIAKVTHQQLIEIAKIKWPDLTAIDMNAAVRCLAGTAKTMGIEAEGL